VTITGAQVSVGTSATLIAAADADGSSVAVTLPSSATATVYLGGSGVTTSGYGLPTGCSVTIDLDSGESLYGIVASGTQTVHTLKNRA
jgi:hypothetical protein